jgi:glycosyltransferase involved in cell wall biosynthesis
VDAVIWLCQDIMPLVWKHHPEIQVTLLGNNPPSQVKALQSDRVIVTGYIRDPEPYFLSNRIFVAPLRYGAGMKGKLGHSLSYSLPSVTTSIGAEGMGLTNGYDVLIADNTQEFAQAILDLYNNKKEWSHISKNAHLSIQKYSSENIQNNLKALLDSFI